MDADHLGLALKNDLQCKIPFTLIATVSVVLGFPAWGVFAGKRSLYLRNIVSVQFSFLYSCSFSF